MNYREGRRKICKRYGIVRFSGNSGSHNAMNKMAKLVRKQNGNVVGAFSIRTNCSDLEIMSRTREALNDLNLT